MDAISDLVNLLSDTEKIDFRAYLKKKNKRHDVKNVRLFDLIETDDINAINKLYKTAKNRDSYHALRKRLQENLLSFISQKVFEKHQHADYELLRLLVVSRYLLENNLARLGFRCLDRAEGIAEDQESYSVLQEILMLRLQFAHLDENLDLENLSSRFLLNQGHLIRESKMQLAYAFIRRELNEIQLKGKVIDLTKLIEEVIRRYKIAVVDFMSYKSLYHILFIANEYAHINQNFGLVEKYVRKSYQIIESQMGDSTGQVYYRMYVLYYLANFNLRSRDFQKSLSYLESMDLLLGKHKDFHGQFYFRKQLVLALNLHFSGEAEQALEVLDAALAMNSAKAKLEDYYDLQLCKVMFQAQRGDRKCLSGISMINHSDTWLEKKLGMLWTIRKSLLEILIYADFSSIDLASARIKSFRRRYRKYLIQTHEEKVLDYVSLLEKYFVNPAILHNKSFQSRVIKLLELEENRDLFNLSFITWIIAKWEKADSYKLTLKYLKDQSGIFTDKNDVMAGYITPIT
ncbi:hypothetical protein [Sphingobacterium kyonggiense]